METLSPRRVERFWTLVDKTDSCWYWTGGTTPDGYGVFYMGDGQRFNRRAPRISWFLEHGEWPESGIYVCHHCDNPRCVNPIHLYLADNEKNMRDAMARGLFKVPTHCKRGHPLDERPYRLRKTGRTCRACVRLRDSKRNYREERKAREKEGKK